MSDRSRDGGRLFIALLVGVLMGIVAVELARRLGPRVALAPGHPSGPQVREVEPGATAGPVDDATRLAAPVAGSGIEPEVTVEAVEDTPSPTVPASGSEADTEVEEEPDSMPGNGTHEAPDGYPVKGNKRSGIYHVPGGFAYDRTIATTFFRTPEAAERAGYRAAKV